MTAARSVYPWALGIGPGGGPSDGGGLVWLAERDTRALESPDVPVTSFINVKLRDPDEARLLNRHDPAVAPAFENTWVNMKTWQHIADQDFVMLRNSQPILVIGSWLLSFLAVGGVATLAAGRAARQARRVGLLKAVGATPGLIAAVLLAEYLVLALLADALGLAIAGLAAPTVVNPSASLVSTAIGPSGDTIAFTTVAAVFAAVLTTAGPTLRALRTGTVSALADTARRPRRRAWLNRMSAPLPTSLLLGLRLIARPARPRRPVRVHHRDDAARGHRTADGLRPAGPGLSGLGHGDPRADRSGPPPAAGRHHRGDRARPREHHHGDLDPRHGGPSHHGHRPCVRRHTRADRGRTVGGAAPAGPVRRLRRCPARDRSRPVLQPWGRAQAAHVVAPRRRGRGGPGHGGAHRRARTHGGPPLRRANPGRRITLSTSAAINRVREAAA
ncbi:FtsX-like permease family protein [Actinomadura madurae]|nr:FtsX-like permease family protein [Actinomadura madurae]